MWRRKNRSTPRPMSGRFEAISPGPRVPGFGRSRRGTAGTQWRELPFKTGNLTLLFLEVSDKLRSRPKRAGGERQVSGEPNQAFRFLPEDFW